MYKRKAINTVSNVNDTFRVLLVTGPRQVGKTTLLKSCMTKKMNYVTLDDDTLRTQAKENPKLFLEEHPFPLLIDEVQYAPALFPYIKMIVDEKNERGMYWLTGSQQFNLMKNVKESMAGRVGIIKLNSFCYSEINNKNVKDNNIFEPGKYIQKDYINVENLYENIFLGGMPELYNVENMDKNLFFQSYLDTYLTRDVKELVNVFDLNTFKNFMISVASRNGEQLNYTNIANEIGVNDKTVKAWMNVLISSGIVYLLEPFMNTKLKRVTHMPKIIFMDSGLCSFLAGWNSAKDLQMSSNAGHYLETYIISDIIKSYNAKGIEPNISYYRDKEKNEIDLIIESNNTIYPFEIKKTANPNISMIKNFSKLDQFNKKIGEGGLICCYDKLMHLDEKNYIIPISSVIDLD